MLYTVQTHTHTTRTQQLYKGNYLRVLQTAQLFPLFHCVCVCFSVRNFHAKSNAILGKSFSKNTKSSSADDPHVIHQRQCLSAKLTIQSRQLRRQRRRRLQSQQQRRWLRHEVFFFSGAAAAFVSRWPTLPAPLCVCVFALYAAHTHTETGLYVYMERMWNEIFGWSSEAQAKAERTFANVNSLAVDAPGRRFSL